MENNPLTGFLDSMGILSTRQILEAVADAVSKNRDKAIAEIARLQQSVNEAENLQLFLEELLTRPELKLEDLLAAIALVSNPAPAEEPRKPQEVLTPSTIPVPQEFDKITFTELTGNAGRLEETELEIDMGMDMGEDDQARALARMEERKRIEENAKEGQEAPFEAGQNPTEKLKDMEGYFFRVYDPHRDAADEDEGWLRMDQKNDKVTVDTSVYIRAYKASDPLWCEIGQHEIDRNHFYVKKWSAYKTAKGRGLKSNSRAFGCLQHFQKPPLEVRTPAGKIYNYTNLPYIVKGRNNGNGHNHNHAA